MMMDVEGKSSGGVIKAIDGTSVHRICSGQVILNLATAVKELIENSIDAVATSVEVRLKEHGSEVIEVVDNGCGVEECNFQGLTLKHHTSKLKDFSDLVSVDTFGFRGEALSSLCAVSDVAVTTCHVKAKNATKLEFDHSGRITSQGPCARQQGTTVTVQNLFSTLPVRYKEFQRNLKKEFTKMVQVLTAYCLISTGVRITCTNQVGKGKKTTIASVNGNKLVRENITNIFGPKQQSSIIEFQQYKPTEDVCSDLGVKITSDQQLACPFQISGFVSSCQHGKGRSSTDRQFIYVNCRPCDLLKVSRTINEVYHMYNRHQYPFAVLNICLSKESVDVNVTPDKRQIFVENEKLLLAIIKSSLIRMFEPLSSTYEMAQGKGGLGLRHDVLSKFRRMSDSVIPSSSSGSSPSKLKSSVSSSLATLKRSFSSAFAREREELERGAEDIKSKQPKLDTFFATLPKTPTDFDPPDSAQSSQSNASDDSGCVFIEHVTQGETSRSTKEGCDSESDIEQDSDSIRHTSLGLKIEYHRQCLEKDSMSPDIDNSSGVSSCEHSGSFKLSDFSNVSGANTKELAQPEGEISEADKLSSLSQTSKIVENSCVSSTSKQNYLEIDNKEQLPVRGTKDLVEVRSAKVEDDEHIHEEHIFQAASLVTQSCKKDSLSSESKSPSNVSPESVPSNSSCSTSATFRLDSRGHEGPRSTREGDDCRITFTEFDKQEKVTSRKLVEVSFSMDALKRKMIMKKLSAAPERSALTYRHFRATIQPDSNSQAEEELQKEISKDMFSKMEILGQFNLGFILARLDQDLFIIDQHATDEKFNFETLQRTTVLEGQKMIQPLKLELTAVGESVIMENLAIFKKNGFDFIIDEDAPPTEKISLVATPVSKNWLFGKSDIEEMVFMLGDSPGVMCRPSRVRQMFASRACRKSIMIGTALNKTEMKKLVCHMGEIEQPWNCPHGRPTMRHLINLNMLPDQND
ncbi:mismatch repair endonuclease PMS2-like [Lineus longissimus]|uniref:mismatch repair endonuclease PMS2-like n=1 Tax=Lineus longissimus TaxID=88925 RepID=UPI002B4F2ECF